MNTRDDLEIVGFDRTESGVAEMNRWTAVAGNTLVGETVTRGRLDVIFVDEDEMAELNMTHMGHTGPTDVLSFPLDGSADDVQSGEEAGSAGSPDVNGNNDVDDIFANLSMDDLVVPEGDLGGRAGPGDANVAGSDLPLHLGDIVVCPAVAFNQAAGHAGNFDAEMTLLIIHGTLHILGHDHAEPGETDLMQGRERVHMEAAGFDHPRWAGNR